MMEVLEQLRREYNLPAISAAVVDSERVLVTGAAGVRVVGQLNRVTINDRFHIGSLTKPMTATMMAVLVEKGEISWNTTLADAFPELQDRMHPSLQMVTLEQLLSHRGGLQPFEEDKELEQLPGFTGSPVKIRKAFSEWLVCRGATSPVGDYVYSNAGYGLAAAMVERATGKEWESLMQELLFKPLGLNSAGFGWPARTHPDEPWGHRGGDPEFIPHSPNDTYQLAPFIAPAGDVHLNIVDLASFAHLHLAALNGLTKLLQATTFERLHQPIGDYALGWNVQRIRELPASTHSGSAGTFYAGIMVYPQKNIAIVIAINAIGKGVDEARNKLFSLLLRQYKAIE
jgi:D-alanyl-D-alanine carboxypeptidase